MLAHDHVQNLRYFANHKYFLMAAEIVFQPLENLSTPPDFCWLADISCLVILHQLQAEINSVSTQVEHEAPVVQQIARQVDSLLRTIPHT